MNKLKLKGIILAHGDTQKDLADFIGISQSRLNAKINEKHGAEFTQREIKKIGEKYALTSDEICEIFFAKLVS